MFTVTVTETFVAQHFLTLPDPPADEATLHSHTFEAEVTFRGPELGPHGYLLDIDAAREALSAAAETYRDETLNDHLDGNPSVERLAVALFADLSSLEAPAVTELTVAISEDDTAVASYTAAVD
ncbi:PtpS family protein [Natronomonas pharaonis DSM 2160]|uniref:PtpS family protein n=1 Tax=Natronomonas pharaonis (strain ATCC 35678 / DSM 2160 / CIP 103997 / JCM 8858 / NBRC 14720 / NCIMB 2260 / Gabara) TaxID=348780 RepID=A0A1U7EUT1_NATPD|nr:6-carboxytetrahydropterin synthase [Natronomonas pharaonis]CAI48762.1 PtpS family protein [Natronomonas pharaonis DSM 2160]